MPEQLSLHDDKIGLRIEFGAHRAGDFLDDAALNFLALTIPGVEILGERHGLGQVAGEQQTQGCFGGFQPSGGVETRRELKTDVMGAQHGGRLRGLFQGNESGSLRQVQSLQPGGDQNAVFSNERNQVGNRAQCDQIE